MHESHLPYQLHYTDNFVRTTYVCCIYLIMATMVIWTPSLAIATHYTYINKGIITMCNSVRNFLLPFHIQDSCKFQGILNVHICTLRLRKYCSEWFALFYLEFLVIVMLQSLSKYSQGYCWNRSMHLIEWYNIVAYCKIRLNSGNTMLSCMK